jgi:type VI protein secretion system component VasK
VGAADRLRSWGRKVVGNPWLAIGIVIGVLLICAWIAWAVHVWSDHGARQGIGVLIVWPAIVAVLAVISIPFIWAFRVIRASAGSEGSEDEVEAESGDADGAEREAAEPGDQGESKPEAEAATG